ncbi:hypothetical protein GUITHDRAFT_156262 [Guillardia theta CCMP2712]|uniref:PX domain-containing protein n=1 Tax=Guillardia theta (strain CCMP2712) TaxID=905079 RepID=L1I9Z4_GUITC|nr:hypothetical protein GUITHDRAFT_156262 [Guillardia theta CCMP2712]EKX32670.1 hypothetical protein GUITHDRAFT_156262 [Guillardia theta CCMP2712]|mmetsp:Transcript_20938/g.69905  ORF Transcript_20938/g.69905 Transcript_20938/m.69905 type:complete len:218 (+) Transcript_20938:110-763(+)|eukprot:XP_005819650.1 hypothetical protein GUITHDRAFT_156262 [Guillardia theta CCMP2712]
MPNREGGSAVPSRSSTETCHPHTIHRLQVAIIKSEARSTHCMRTKAMQHFVAYEVICSLSAHGSHPSLKWQVWHRYNEFREFRDRLVQINPKSFADLQFPPKRWFSGMSEATVDERKAGLEKYLEDAIQRCEKEDEAFVFDAFLEISKHNRPPQTNQLTDRREKHLRLETDSVNHNTTEDIMFAENIRRCDTLTRMHDRKPSPPARIPGFNQNGSEA